MKFSLQLKQNHLTGSTTSCKTITCLLLSALQSRAPKERQKPQINLCLKLLETSKFHSTITRRLRGLRRRPGAGAVALLARSGSRWCCRRSTLPGSESDPAAGPTRRGWGATSAPPDTGPTCQLQWYMQQATRRRGHRLKIPSRAASAPKRNRRNEPALLRTLLLPTLPLPLAAARKEPGEAS